MDHQVINVITFFKEINPEKNMNWAEDAHRGNINEEVRETLLAKVRYSRSDAERQMRRVRVVSVGADAGLLDLPAAPGIFVPSIVRRASAPTTSAGRHRRRRSNSSRNSSGRRQRRNSTSGRSDH